MTTKIKSMFSRITAQCLKPAFVILATLAVGGAWAAGWWQSGTDWSSVTWDGGSTDAYYIGPWSDVAMSFSELYNDTATLFVGQGDTSKHTVTFEAADSTKGLALTGGMTIAFPSNTKGDLVLNEGTYSVTGDINLGTEAGSTASLTVNDGASLSAGGNFNFAYGTSTLTIDGGTMTVSGASTWNWSANSTSQVTIQNGGSITISGKYDGTDESGMNVISGAYGNMTILVDNGTFEVSSGNAYIGLYGCWSWDEPYKTGTTAKGAGTITINNGGVFSVGNSTAGKTLYLSKYGAETFTVNVNQGGTLKAGKILRDNTDGTSTINLNGGTIQALSDNVTLINANVAVTVGSNGGTINVGSFSVEVESVVTGPDSGSGTITKVGSGTLTFTNGTAPASNVNFKLQDGTLVLPAGYAGSVTTDVEGMKVYSNNGTYTLVSSDAGTVYDDAGIAAATEIVDAGSVTVSIANPAQFIGTFNTKGLVKTGAGTLTLFGQNTLEGDVVVNTGTLKLLRDFRDLPSGIAFDFDASYKTAEFITTGETFSWKDAKGSTITLASDGTISPTIQTIDNMNFVGSSQLRVWAKLTTKPEMLFMVWRLNGVGAGWPAPVRNNTNNASGNYRITIDSSSAMTSSGSKNYRIEGYGNGDRTTGSIWSNGENPAKAIVDTTQLLTVGDARWYRGSGSNSAQNTWFASNYDASIGEILGCTEVMSDTARSTVETYLMNKWGINNTAWNVDYSKAEVTVAEGATLDLGGGEWTVKSLTGAGTIQNGTLNVSGTCELDNLTIASDCKVKFETEDYTAEADSAGVKITNGTLTLANGSSVDYALWTSGTGVIAVSADVLTPGVFLTAEGDCHETKITIKGIQIAGSYDSTSGKTTWGGANTYYWTNGGDDTLWSNPLNWGLAAESAIPGSSATVVFSGADTVTLDNNYSVAVVAINGASLTLSGAGSYGLTGLTAISGTGAVILNDSGIVASRTFDLNNNVQIAGANKNWLKTSGSNYLDVKGNISSESTTAYLELQHDTHSYGVRLWGDNKDFKGTCKIVNSTSTKRYASVFNSSDSGSASARWIVEGVDNGSTPSLINLTTGTIKFGSLEGAFYLKYPTSHDKDLTIELGGDNSSSSFTASWERNAYGDGFNVVKVGTGTIRATTAIWESGREGGILTLKGGKYVIDGNNAKVSSIVFQGGTLGIANGITYDVSPLIQNNTEAISIDVEGSYDYAMGTALNANNSGGLTKKGSGTLTLGKVPKYTGATAVEAGRLVVPFGTELANVDVASGATLAVDLGGIAHGDTVITFTDGAVPEASSIVMLNAPVAQNLYTLVLSEDGKSYTYSSDLDYDPLKFYWIGAEDANWQNGNNWSHYEKTHEGGQTAAGEGDYPKLDTHIANFESASSVTVGASSLVGTVNISGDLTLAGNKLSLGAIVAEDGAKLILGSNAGLAPTKDINLALPIKVTATASAPAVIEGVANGIKTTFSNTDIGMTGDDTAKLCLLGSGREYVISCKTSGFAGTLQIGEQGSTVKARITGSDYTSDNTNWVIYNTGSSNNTEYNILGSGYKDRNHWFKFGSLSGVVNNTTASNYTSSNYPGSQVEIGKSNKSFELTYNPAASSRGDYLHKVGSGVMTLATNDNGLRGLYIENGGLGLTLGTVKLIGDFSTATDTTVIVPLATTGSAKLTGVTTATIAAGTNLTLAEAPTELVNYKVLTANEVTLTSANVGYMNKGVFTALPGWSAKVIDDSDNKKSLVIAPPSGFLLMAF